MNAQQQLDFQRITCAIAYLQQHFREQPSLEQIAEYVHLSPYHFQRLFTEWAGTSPKKFTQYLSVGYAKSVLHQPQATLFDAAAATGLSGTGRLHDLFLSIEGMTPGEYKHGGASLTIRYRYAESLFGPVLVASTDRGVCHLAFAEDAATGLEELRQQFPQAKLVSGTDPMQENALRIFSRDWGNLSEVKLHLKGTDFQLRVWDALLRIPTGRLSSYGAIAQQIGQPGASRAVGTAIGDNPVAFLIPCHRVIQSTGAIGNYHWGSTRKAAIIGWEAALVHP